MKSSFDNEIHRKMATELFNSTWDLIEKKDRTELENDAMIHAAHASRFHWGMVGTPTNFARGEWQISRVYSIVDRPAPALIHANKSLAYCLENQLSNFDTGFAYEAAARAFAIKGDMANRDKNLELSKQYAGKINKQSDRQWLLENIYELEAIFDKIEKD